MRKPSRHSAAALPADVNPQVCVALKTISTVNKQGESRGAVCSQWEAAFLGFPATPALTFPRRDGNTAALGFSRIQFGANVANQADLPLTKICLVLLTNLHPACSCNCWLTELSSDVSQGSFKLNPVP
ncbi:hypothetical protein MHYP_G00230820 [Metynnis hypsauchen]